MMPRPYSSIALLIVVLLALGNASAQDGDEAVPYIQARGLNAPVLEGWEDQSSGDVAQFHLAEAGATIRTAMVEANDAINAVANELEHMAGSAPAQPLYEGKVNLADGTWTVLAYDISAAVTASFMARRLGEQFVVISFVESAPETRTIMLTLARADEAQADAAPEIGRALEQTVGFELSQPEEARIVELPSGEWLIYERIGLSAMGMVYGNESYIALQEGELGDLAVLADAWNRTLLGFFITPDNSGYLALGLAVVFVILGTLVFSFVWRERSIQKDLALLDALSRADESSQSAGI